MCSLSTTLKRHAQEGIHDLADTASGAALPGVVVAVTCQQKWKSEPYVIRSDTSLPHQVVVFVFNLVCSTCLWLLLLLHGPVPLLIPRGLARGLRLRRGGRPRNDLCDVAHGLRPALSEHEALPNLLIDLIIN